MGLQHPTWLNYALIIWTKGTERTTPPGGHIDSQTNISKIKFYPWESNCLLSSELFFKLEKSFIYDILIVSKKNSIKTIGPRLLETKINWCAYDFHLTIFYYFNLGILLNN